MDFVVQTNYWVNAKKSESLDKYQDLARELEKAVEHERNTNHYRSTWNDLQEPRKKVSINRRLGEENETIRAVMKN